MRRAHYAVRARDALDRGAFILNEREWEVLRRRSEGETLEQIAAALSPHPYSAAAVSYWERHALRTVATRGIGRLLLGGAWWWRPEEQVAYAAYVLTALIGWADRR